MNTESNAPKNESTTTSEAPKNTAAPIVEQRVNWKQAAANTGMLMGTLAVIGGGIYVARKFRK